MEELLASSFMFGFLCLDLIFIFFISYQPHLPYISHLICLFTSFLQALNFVFSKIKMFKLLFILFVIKQLLSNLTSDIDTYSAKLSIFRLGKAKWCNSDGSIAYLKRTIFCVYLLYFASTSFCEWQVFENFQFLNFSPYEKDS